MADSQSTRRLLDSRKAPGLPVIRQASKMETTFHSMAVHEELSTKPLPCMATAREKFWATQSSGIQTYDGQNEDPELEGP